MDRGTLLSIYAVISGWLLILLALFLTKLVISSGSRDLVNAIVYLASGAVSIALALGLWYLSVRKAFLKLKGMGPGGLEPPTSRFSPGLL